MNVLTRRARKRRARDLHDSAVPSRDVDTCEYLAQGDLALVRVSGSGYAEPTALVVDDGEAQTFPPLPAGPTTGATTGPGWRAAFAIPAGLVERDARFDLELAGGGVLELTTPVAAGEPRATGDLESARAEPSPEDSPRMRAAKEKLEALELTARQMRSADTSRAQKLVEAWSECNTLRERLGDREEAHRRALEELAVAEQSAAHLRAELDIAQTVIETAAANNAELVSAREAIAAKEGEIAALHGRVGQLEAELQAIAERNEAGRRGLLRRRRTDGSAAPAVNGAERAEVAALEGRIAELEEEATSFVARRDNALNDSLRERVAELERDLREERARAGDLRSILDSERLQASRTREEMDDLRRTLATSDVREAALDADAEEITVRRATSPPWSALDDELLARIEKAKALASSG